MANILEALATHYHIKPKSHFLKFDPSDWFCAVVEVHNWEFRPGFWEVYIAFIWGFLHSCVHSFDSPVAGVSVWQILFWVCDCGLQIIIDESLPQISAFFQCGVPRFLKKYLKNKIKYWNLCVSVPRCVHKTFPHFWRIPTLIYEIMSTRHLLLLVEYEWYGYICIK
jgi:hypothetical protein